MLSVNVSGDICHSCKKTLGSSYFSTDMNGASPSEFTWDAFEAFSSAKQKGASTDDVMTEKERTVQRMSTAEVDMGSANVSRHCTCVRVVGTTGGLQTSRRTLCAFRPRMH